MHTLFVCGLHSGFVPVLIWKYAECNLNIILKICVFSFAMSFVRERLQFEEDRNTS